MYYIERVPIDDATFLAGSVAEPTTSETAWVAGTYAVGAEVIRPALHRVFRCAVARTASNTLPPEQDVTSWVDVRSTQRWLPFGPLRRADGKLVHQNYALSTTTGDIEYRLKLRYANAVALFGLRGATWTVSVYAAAGDPTPVKTVSGTIKAPASCYYEYAYGQRRMRDRVLVTGLPIYPGAEVRIKITANPGQERCVSQIEPGKLRFLPGVTWGGVLSGLRRSPRAYSYRKEEADGSSTTLLYGSTYDMSGNIKFDGANEDNALIQLRNLLGKGVAYAPTLAPGFEQSLVFGTMEAADAERESASISGISFQIRGLPTS